METEFLGLDVSERNEGNIQPLIISTETNQADTDQSIKPTYLLE